MILVLIFLKNIIIIYEIKRNAGGNYAKRCIKGKKVTIRTIEESDIKHYGISYLKKKAQNGRNGMRHISRSQCKNTLPIKRRCKLVCKKNHCQI